MAAPATVSRTGYTFAGWKVTTAAGSWVADTIYNNSPQTTLTGNTGAYGNVTFTAQWTANTTTVTLNQQSGSGGTASVTATYGSAMPSATMPTRTGYTFGGYYDATGGSGTKYYNANGTSARTWNKTTSTSTLYAQWTLTSYTATFKPNSGTWSDSTTANKTASYTIDDVLVVPATISRTGYTFKGWKVTTAAGNWTSSTTYNNSPQTTLAGTSGKYGSASFTAQWTIQSFAITASSNNNTYGSVSGGGTYNYGADATLIAEPNTGYTFVGWYVNNTQVSTDNPYTFTVTAAKTVEGRFTGISITTSAGTGGTVSPSGTNIYASDTSVTLTATANSKYRFAYWLEGSTQYGQNPYTFTATTNRTLTAIFTATRTVSLSVSPSGYGTVTGAGNYDLNSNATVTATPTSSTTINYSFVNWTKSGTSVSTNTSYTF